MNTMEELRERLKQIPPDADEEHIISTASDLRGMNYTPILLFDTPSFFTMRAEDISNEFERIAALSDNEVMADVLMDVPADKIKLNHLNLLLYHYLLLCRLRKGDPDAWDEINELYEDD